ncbi:MAG TPA: 2Fe-2S iron-sulfur cluster-binding protein [Gammaproteobacteria bacterium]|nr:2Fe-2S iron-sulfur cluster-binding protein [Gammaproteobacteria bacterium]
MPKVTFQPGGRVIEVDAGTTILIGATRNGIAITHDCTEGICGTDIARVVEGADNLSAKSEAEDLTLETMDAGPEDRLCCMAKVMGDVTVELQEDDD